MNQGIASNAEAAGAAAPHVWFLPAEPVSASVLRRDLQTLLVLLPPAVLDDVVLTASELVANAVLHGAGPITVSVWPGGHGAATRRGDVCRSIRATSDPNDRPD